MHCKSYSHFFSKKCQHICISLDVNFNESLTNYIVSFEQLGPDFHRIHSLTFIELLNIKECIETMPDRRCLFSLCVYSGISIIRTIAPYAHIKHIWLMEKQFVPIWHMSFTYCAHFSYFREVPDQTGDVQAGLGFHSLHIHWCFALLVKFSAGNILKYFSYFPENRIWHFMQSVSIQQRQFTWFFKTCFLGKIRKISPICRLLN